MTCVNNYHNKQISGISFFPTRTTQVEDNRPLNISSTDWKHSAVLHYAGIDLSIYTSFSSLRCHH